MATCPDCDDRILAKVLREPGNGICGDCHGTGEEDGLLDQMGATFALTDLEPCRSCNGSKQCQTCGGTGEVDDDEADHGSIDEESSQLTERKDGRVEDVNGDSSRGSSSTGGYSRDIESGSGVSDSYSAHPREKSETGSWPVIFVVVIALVIIGNRKYLFQQAPIQQSAEEVQTQIMPQETAAEKAKGQVVLTVRSNIYGDTVFIDGKRYGSTRLDIPLIPGHYVVRVEKEGYEPFERPIDLRTDMTLRARLEKATPALIRSVTYNESLSGDLSNSNANPAPLNFGLGANQVVGSIFTERCIKK